MTITAAGFAGTVTEAQWAGINGATPHAEAGGWAPSAYTANGLPQVQLAAGYINGQGVRAYNDAPALVTLTAPGAGGAWYLIAARRTWSPTATCTLVAIAGATTGSSAVPTTPPVAFPTLNNTPGTITDQPLAWAFVAAGSTVATVFDARLRRTGGSTLLAPSLQVLNAHVTLGTFTDGAVVAVAQHAPAGGTGNLRASAWRVRQIDANAPYATPERAMQGTAGTIAALSTLFAAGSALTGLSLNTIGGLLVADEPSGILYRYVGAGGTTLGGANTTALFQAWEKPAASWTPTWASGMTPGASTYVALWGISSGQVWAYAHMVAGTGYTLSNVTDVIVNLPSPIIGVLSVGSGQYEKSGLTTGTNQVDLAVYAVGTPGASTNGVRFKAKWVAATAAAVSDAVLGASVTPTTTDSLQFSVQAPSATVA